MLTALALAESFESSLLEGFDKIPITIAYSGSIHLNSFARGSGPVISVQVEMMNTKQSWKFPVCFLILISRYTRKLVEGMMIIGLACCMHTEIQSVIID